MDSQPKMDRYPPWFAKVLAFSSWTGGVVVVTCVNIFLDAYRRQNSDNNFLFSLPKYFIDVLVGVSGCMTVFCLLKIIFDVVKVFVRKEKNINGIIWVEVFFLILVFSAEIVVFLSIFTTRANYPFDEWVLLEILSCVFTGFILSLGGFLFLDFLNRTFFNWKEF